MKHEFPGQLNTVGHAFIGFASSILLESAVPIGLVPPLESVLRNRVRAVVGGWLVTLVLVQLILIPLFLLSPPSTYWLTGTAAYADPISPLPASHTKAPLSRRATEQSQTTSPGVGERPRTLTWRLLNNRLHTCEDLYPFANRGGDPVGVYYEDLGHKNPSSMIL